MFEKSFWYVVKLKNSSLWYEDILSISFLAIVVGIIFLFLSKINDSFQGIGAFLLMSGVWTLIITFLFFILKLLGSLF
jgi:hypothetical protein